MFTSHNDVVKFLEDAAGSRLTAHEASPLMAQEFL